MDRFDLSQLYGENVFNDESMRKYLPTNIYKQLRATIDQNKPLDPAIADSVANGMRLWALEKGATHYTHWFQPMTGFTAEKHDSFLNPLSDGSVLMTFSGKELIRGESDASSFPSGGLRATFEARGYTAWDCTSPAFVKDNTLYVPTCFCSFTGEVLDRKTPLLRSMEVLSNQAVRVLHLLGKTDVERVMAMAGAEQEYFLVDKALFDQRLDLMLCDRTLFGARPPKGQEMDGHYYGNIKERVMDFMRELDEELWRLGVPAKTEHNEAAPAQHELAAVYTTANIACDNNQLIMETMKKVALRKNLVCLLHEKPFDGVNGSGKHNNWSIATDAGQNLLSPGETPYENAQFLLFLCAVIKAVDDYQDLLRIAVATAGNDHRLGANEAPPAVVSIFLGDELNGVLEAIENGTPYHGAKKTQMTLGVDVLPQFSRDTTDRNRTSPFAFTGNKFEFRMLGSSNSIACANIMLNSAVAESLKSYADRLEGAADFKTALNELIKKTIKDHKRIIFNGNGYDDSWLREAEARGLSNYRTTADCMPHLLDKKNVDMLTSHKVYSEAELKSRCEIMLENYCKTIVIEANTMIDMAKTQIAPAVEAYTADVAKSATAKKTLDSSLACTYETGLVRKLSSLTDRIALKLEALEESLISLHGAEDVVCESRLICDKLLPAMSELRVVCDEAETLTAKSYWPFPTYADLLFGVK